MKEALKGVEEESGEKLSIAVAYRYKASAVGKKLILEVREKYLRDLSSVPIYNKRVRLERLEREYHNAVEVKDKVKVLSEARKEVEGEGGGDVYLQLNQFNGMSDIELAQRRAKIMEEVKELAAKGMMIEGEAEEVVRDG